MNYSFKFDEFDNPMHLSKVGNWVITFLSPKEQLKDIQLALTYVIPRQADLGLQARKIIIQQSQHANEWNILNLECFNSENNEELILNLSTETAQNILQQVILEFQKYDVEIHLNTH